jgi:hypothetical protein
MEIVIAAVVGAVCGWLWCRRGNSKAIPVPPSEKDQPVPPSDPMNDPSEDFTPGVPDNDEDTIIDEASSPAGVDAGTTTFETDEIIERDVGTPNLQQGAEAIEATSGRDATAPFAPRPSIGSLGAFTDVKPVPATDPGAVPAPEVE